MPKGVLQCRNAPARSVARRGYWQVNTRHGENDEITVPPDASKARSILQVSSPLGSNSRWGRRKEITSPYQNDFRRGAAQAVLHHHGTRNAAGSDSQQNPANHLAPADTNCRDKSARAFLSRSSVLS